VHEHILLFLDTLKSTQKPWVQSTVAAIIRESEEVTLPTEI